MANRTNSDAVKATLFRNYDFNRNPNLEGFISDANDIVNEIVAADVHGKISVSRAMTLEKYISAHLYCLSDPTFKQRATEGASGTMLGSGGQGYEASFFGQHAKRIDPTGYLADQDLTLSEKGMNKIKGFSLGSNQDS